MVRWEEDSLKIYIDLSPFLDIQHLKKCDEK